MKRVALIVASVVLVAAAGYHFLGGATTVSPQLQPSKSTATIGEGSEAIGVSAEGAIISWLPLPEDAALPRLPLTEIPKGGRLAGPALQQARVLGATPPVLLPCIGGSYYGESGVDVELRSGIELRFGDASRAAEKWRAAATVLANPSINSLDYVDLHFPNRPAIEEGGTLLPPPSEAPGGGCAA